MGELSSPKVDNEDENKDATGTQDAFRSHLTSSVGYT